MAVPALRRTPDVHSSIQPREDPPKSPATPIRSPPRHNRPERSRRRSVSTAMPRRQSIAAKATPTVTFNEVATTARIQSPRQTSTKLLRGWKFTVGAALAATPWRQSIAAEATPTVTPQRSRENRWHPDPLYRRAPNSPGDGHSLWERLQSRCSGAKASRLKPLPQ
jgi:hypothetical protein